MKRINTCLVGCMALLCLACTDKATDTGGAAATATTAGTVQTCIDVSTPEAYTRMFTRTLSEENESVLDGRFAVFAFQDNALLFTLKNGDTNTATNLTDAESAYGDYTASPALTWHYADDTQAAGRLYIEHTETAGTVRLLVLANVDLDKISAMLGEVQGTEATITTGMTQAQVAAALAPALDFDVTDTGLVYIPMAGECDLDDGITLGSKGSLYLRRSVAKFTVYVEYTVERLGTDYDGDIANAPFQPNYVEITNLNKYATVYNASTDTPDISTLNEEEDTFNPTLTFPDEWTRGTNNDGDDVYYKEVVFYVAETENSRVADTDEYDVDSHISVLVEGSFDDNDGTTLDENWYRLDLIPEDATSEEEELPYILRNHHYRFVLSDALKRGSTSMDEAIEMTVPDNFPFSTDEGNDIYVQIDDEDILSITVEYYTSGDSDMPYYVGVSSTAIELEYSGDACARVKVVTNFDGWTIDESSIPLAYDNDGNTIYDDEDNPVYAISFVWDDNSSTLWLWLDYPECVTPGETYSYYIVAGNIRKKMRITIVAATTTDND